MLKGKRAKKAYPQILDRLNFDDKIESKAETEAQLDEAVKEQSDSGFDDIFADDNLFGDFDDIFEQENDFSSSDWAKTPPVDLNRPLDPCDPFATGRGARGDASDLDRLKTAVDAYIKVAKSPFTLHSSNHLSEAEALRYIIVYWLDHNRDRLIRDFRRLA